MDMEETILLYIQDYIRNPILDPIFIAITHLGDKGIFWIILTVILLSIKKTRTAGICSACALLGSFLINNLLLKNLFNRIRPYEVIEGLTCLIQPATDASFPSGHTGASFASAVAICRQVPRKYGILLLVLASLIAFSRLYVGIHYPTDVLGGLVTGIALGILAGPRKNIRPATPND
ncbi:MAG: phosphatase PAP2 family protein [Lachnospiraceae bacterium]|nr:phosphatase PAP2 family protein [Lachnospiraceae bacterium]